MNNNSQPNNPTHSIVITALMAAISIVLGWTHWGLIPWFGGAALTILHIPAIIAALIAGPISGAAVGLIFGFFSMVQAAVAPTGPADVWFTNPLLSILPRLLIGPSAWMVYRFLKKFPSIGLAVAGAVGSLVNTGLVLGLIGLLKFLPWSIIGGIALVNGLPEMAASAIITTVVVSTYWRLPYGSQKGAHLD